ncbi:hypothetical protein GQ54DRAFT_314589 [Martensiomyces pterosporus]|nr:hypothetical protein GQ54DRAFT_314589 [Martensiomyces pterosporus]
MGPGRPTAQEPPVSTQAILAMMGKLTKQISSLGSTVHTISQAVKPVQEYKRFMENISSHDALIEQLEKEFQLLQETSNQEVQSFRKERVVQYVVEPKTHTALNNGITFRNAVASIYDRSLVRNKLQIDRELRFPIPPAPRRNIMQRDQQTVPVPTVYCDSEGTIHSKHTGAVTEANKHCKSTLKLPHYAEKAGLCKLQYVPTGDQAADFLTKQLLHDAFSRHRRAIGMKSSDNISISQPS